MKFLIVAAKTGGHIFPSVAIASELIKKNHQVVFLGIGSSIEKIAQENFNFPKYSLAIDGYRGKNTFEKIKVLFQVFKAIFSVAKIIRNEKVSAMIGFGGFITVPAGIASWLYRKPIFLHEQNAILGSANKLVSKFSKIVFLGFPIKNLKNSKLVGNPLRETFKYHKISEIKQDNHINIYITGGSQGADFFNSELPKAFQGLEHKLNIRHQCGKNRSSEVEKLYQSIDVIAEVKDFYRNPEDQIIWSDFVISRAGALSLSETVSLNKGILMIPLPTSIDNHQNENAKSVEEIEMGMIHNQNNSINELRNKITKILVEKIYLDWQLKKINIHLNSKKIIIENIERILQNEKV